MSHHISFTEKRRARLRRAASRCRRLRGVSLCFVFSLYLFGGRLRGVGGFAVSAFVLCFRSACSV